MGRSDWVKIRGLPYPESCLAVFAIVEAVATSQYVLQLIQRVRHLDVLRPEGTGSSPPQAPRGSACRCPPGPYRQAACRSERSALVFPSGQRTVTIERTPGSYSANFYAMSALPELPYSLLSSGFMDPIDLLSGR